MALKVYDYRTDIRNVLVTPQIRARLLRMEVGQVNRGHTHDLGHEVFLILQGRAEFEIEGEKAVLGPGQLCIALADESHTVRNVGDVPVIMYLSVTPHIQPTHTGWTEAGAQEPVSFRPSAVYDVPLDGKTPTKELLDHHRSAVEAFARAAEAATKAQRQGIAAMGDVLAEGDKEAALAALAGMWETLYPTFKQAYEMASTWNDLASRSVAGEP